MSAAPFDDLRPTPISESPLHYTAIARGCTPPCQQSPEGPLQRPLVWDLRCRRCVLAVEAAIHNGQVFALTRSRRRAITRTVPEAIEEAKAMAENYGWPA